MPCDTLHEHFLHMVLALGTRAYALNANYHPRQSQICAYLSTFHSKIECGLHDKMRKTEDSTPMITIGTGSRGFVKPASHLNDMNAFIWIFVHIVVPEGDSY